MQRMLSFDGRLVMMTVREEINLRVSKNSSLMYRSTFLSIGAVPA